MTMTPFVSVETNAPSPAGDKPFGPPRESVFPLRFHDLAGSPLIELWDLPNAGRPEALVCIRPPPWKPASLQSRR